jgi:hypothetical protein
MTFPMITCLHIYLASDRCFLANHSDMVVSFHICRIRTFSRTQIQIFLIGAMSAAEVECEVSEYQMCFVMM